MRGALILVVASALTGVVSPVRADPIGWRIEVRSCRGADCRELPASRRRWLGRFACEGRADAIERFGEAPRGRTLRARCLAIEGMVGA